jgi:hypothetical protein
MVRRSAWMVGALPTMPSTGASASSRMSVRSKKWVSATRITSPSSSQHSSTRSPLTKVPFLLSSSAMRTRRERDVT